MRRLLLIGSIVVLAATLGPNPESPHCIGAMRALAAEQAPGQQKRPPAMPPPGNPNHEKPADGAFCARSKDEARNCACHAKCIYGPDGKLVEIQEDGARCRANCFKNHCHCPADCE